MSRLIENYTIEDVIEELDERTKCRKENRVFLYTMDNHKVRIIRPGCKQWNCAHCAARKRGEWAMRIYHGVDFYSVTEGATWNFVTLTSHKKLKTFESTLAVWPRAWAKLSTRLRREAKSNGSTMRYVLLPEHHRDKRLHTHMIVNQPFGIRLSKRGKWYSSWLKKQAAQCGLGHQADIKPVGNAAGAAYYTTKYIAKTLDVDDWPRGLRRVRTSQSWPTIPREETEEIWAVVYNPDALARLMLRWRVAGLSLQFG